MAEKITNQRLEQIGQRLRQLRTQRGETMAIHEKISKRYAIRLKQSYYSKLERGLVSPPLRTLYALADYFETDIHFLLESPAYGKESKLRAILQDPKLLVLLEKFAQNTSIEQATQYLSSILKLNIQLLEKNKKQRKKR